MVVERRLHNMPWLKKSARKAAAAAAKSTKKPVILPPAHVTEPLERRLAGLALQMGTLSTVTTAGDLPTSSANEPAKSPEDVAESAAEPSEPPVEPPSGDESAAKPPPPRVGRRALSLRRLLQSE